jgi:hypothetical protein
VDANDERSQRTPREEAVVQAVQLAAMLIVVTAGPLLERMMSDPDVGYLIRWHAKSLERRVALWLHEAGVLAEVGVGLFQTSQFLRSKWKKETV